MPSPTTLLEAIQAAWTADAALAALVPDSRAYFGKVPPAGSIGDDDPTTPEMPYARIEKPAGETGLRTNASLYLDQTVIVHVWTDSSDAGDQIAAEVAKESGSPFGPKI